MPNKKKARNIRARIRSNMFKPNGIPARELEITQLEMDEIEALRLANFKNINHRDAAEKMKISKSTFQRILASANYKIANSILNGKAIEIMDPKLNKYLTKLKANF